MDIPIGPVGGHSIESSENPSPIETKVKARSCDRGAGYAQAGEDNVMDMRLQCLTASVFFLTTTLLAAIAGCRPADIDEVSNGETGARVNETFLPDAEIGVSQLTPMVDLMQNSHTRDLLGALAEALPNEEPRSGVISVLNDPDVTDAETGVSEISPSTSDESIVPEGPLDQPGWTPDDPTAVDFLNEAQALDP